MMPEAVYRMLTLLCGLVEPLPVGTHLGMLHVPWMVVSGRLLEARGAVIRSLSACGLPERAVRRAWAALGQGAIRRTSSRYPCASRFGVTFGTRVSCG